MTSIYKALVSLEQENKAAVLCTIIRSQGSTPRHSTSKMLVYPDGQIIGTIGGGEMESRVIVEAIQAMAEGNPRLLAYNMTDPSRGDPGVCGGQVEIFVEPVIPKPTLLLIGGGHVGKSVAHLADWLGFHVVINDDRPEFCNPQAVPEAKQFFPVSIQQMLTEFEINQWTFVVLVTRGSLVDVEGLPFLLDMPARYIGVIGSRRRWEITRKGLLAKGVPEDKLQRVISPIGIELNAETPEEIAVSIMAEVLMVYRRGTGKAMSVNPEASISSE